MKYIMKIRLRPDGTWEHVYDDFENKSKRLSEIASEYLEEAVEASGYKDAKQVIDHIRGLK
jgi:hypothetical protein